MLRSEKPKNIKKTFQSYFNPDYTDMQTPEEEYIPTLKKSLKT